MIPQSCEIDNSECHCGGGRHRSPRFVKPGALIRIWGPRTLGLPLIANADVSLGVYVCLDILLTISVPSFLRACEHRILTFLAV